MEPRDIIAAQTVHPLKSLVGLARAYVATEGAPSGAQEILDDIEALHHKMREFGLSHHNEITTQAGGT